MKILSLFDGISCARVALDRANIEVDEYYASEIDKYALKVSQANYPDIIHIGDVAGIKGDDYQNIDLLVGGSPCQGFSFAGKQLNFNDPRSKLFFEYVRILKEVKPKYFLLENVKMKKEYQDVISEQLGVKPIEINSALVSAQNRKRLYWTNIPDIELPEDRHIYLVDIIENGEVDREKSYTIDANYYKGGSLKNYKEKKRRQLVYDLSDKDAGFKQSEKRLMVKRCGHGYLPDKEYLAEKMPALFTSNSDYFVKDITLRVGSANDINGHDYNKRVYSTKGKSPSLAAKSGGNLEPKIAIDEEHWRKLTPLECERLQTLEDFYTDKGISNTQRYKCLGNAFTVDVIAHILSYMER